MRFALVNFVFLALALGAAPAALAQGPAPAAIASPAPASAPSPAPTPRPEVQRLLEQARQQLATDDIEGLAATAKALRALDPENREVTLYESFVRRGPRPASKYGSATAGSGTPTPAPTAAAPATGSLAATPAPTLPPTPVVAAPAPPLLATPASATPVSTAPATPEPAAPTATPPAAPTAAAHATPGARGTAVPAPRPSSQSWLPSWLTERSVLALVILAAAWLFLAAGRSLRRNRGRLSESAQAAGAQQEPAARPAWEGDPNLMAINLMTDREEPAEPAEPVPTEDALRGRLRASESGPVLPLVPPEPPRPRPPSFKDEEPKDEPEVPPLRLDTEDSIASVPLVEVATGEEPTLSPERAAGEPSFYLDLTVEESAPPPPEPPEPPRPLPSEPAAAAMPEPPPPLPVEVPPPAPPEPPRALPPEPPFPPAPEPLALATPEPPRSASPEPARPVPAEEVRPSLPLGVPEPMAAFHAPTVGPAPADAAPDTERPEAVRARVRADQSHLVESDDATRAPYARGGETVFHSDDETQEVRPPRPEGAVCAFSSDADTQPNFGAPEKNRPRVDSDDQTLQTPRR